MMRDSVTYLRRCKEPKSARARITPVRAARSKSTIHPRTVSRQRFWRGVMAYGPLGAQKAIPWSADSFHSIRRAVQEKPLRTRPVRTRSIRFFGDNFARTVVHRTYSAANFPPRPSKQPSGVISRWLHLSEREFLHLCEKFTVQGRGWCGTISLTARTTMGYGSRRMWRACSAVRQSKQEACRRSCVRWSDYVWGFVHY